MTALGAVGIWESTFGNAAIACVISRLRRRRSPADLSKIDFSRPNQPIKIDLLIPVHNEEKIIQQTLTSLEHAMELSRLKNRATNGIPHSIQIVLGLDHCTDRTEKAAQTWSNTRGVKVNVSRNFGASGKWNMLQQLVRDSRAEWVGLIDAGSVWEAGLLSSILPSMTDPAIMGIAPAYRPVRANFLEKWNWRLERLLKKLENAAGGPVSVHGATVFYRREALMAAFEELKSEEFWLNDDVVIPLTLRTLWPEKHIHYAIREGGEAWVHDYGIRAGHHREYGRRKRMLVGNLQWIRSLNSKAWRADIVVGLIAARRVFRTFWAYWVLFFGLGIALIAIGLLQPSLAVLAAGGVVVSALAVAPHKGSLDRLRAAFVAGIELPFHWVSAAKTAREKIWN